MCDSMRRKACRADVEYVDLVDITDRQIRKEILEYKINRRLKRKRERRNGCRLRPRAILISIGIFTLFTFCMLHFAGIGNHRASELYKTAVEPLYNVIHDYYFVSIVVPDTTEVTICDTVHSLLNLDYRLYEIIVVDDGPKTTLPNCLSKSSDDQGVEKIKKSIRCQDEEFIYESYAYKVPIVLIRKKNGGKADALNMGINASRYPYFVCMDADSMLQSDALERIVRPVLTDENLIACGGVIRIANGVVLENGKVKKYEMPDNMVAAMQVWSMNGLFWHPGILFDMFNEPDNIRGIRII